MKIIMKFKWNKYNSIKNTTSHPIAALIHQKNHCVSQAVRKKLFDIFFYLFFLRKKNKILLHMIFPSNSFAFRNKYIVHSGMEHTANNKKRVV